MKMMSQYKRTLCFDCKYSVNIRDEQGNYYLICSYSKSVRFLQEVNGLPAGAACNNSFERRAQDVGADEPL